MENDYKNLLTAPIRKDRKPLHELLPLEQPLRILIDPCDICNFKCNFCFQSTDRTFKGKMMEMSLFKKVVEQLKEFTSPINIIHLYGLGEPLLNPNLPEFIRLIKTNNLAKEVAITSNGSRLTKQLSAALVESGLNRLSISLNGITNGHFKSVADASVNFEEMSRQIKYFYSIREGCHLHIKINGECFTEEEQNQFIDMFKEYSDTLNIDHVVDVWSGIHNENETMNNMYEIVGGQTEEKHICPQMFYELMIHPDGSVSPCCVDYTYQKCNLGNINEYSVKEIWQGKKLLEMQKQALKKENISYSICNSCQYPNCASTVDITPYRDDLLERY